MTDEPTPQPKVTKVAQREEAQRDQLALWNLADVLAAVNHAEPGLFDFSVPLDAVELIDTIAAIIGDANVTLAELAGRWQAKVYGKKAV